jgi:hypothetical protein
MTRSRRKKQVVLIFGGAFLALLASLPTAFGQTPSRPLSPLPAKPGLEAMEHLEWLPMLYPPGTQTMQFCSHDLSGGNDDGNFAKAFTQYVDPRGEIVIFDAYGPGCLYREQLNLWHWGMGLGEDFGDSRIRFYFDDEPAPRVDMSVDDFFGGGTAPFDEPFSVMDHPGAPSPALPQFGDKKFGIQYYPFPFGKRLKITIVPHNKLLLKSQNSWYQFTYLLYPPDVTVASWALPAPLGNAVRTAWHQLGSDPKPTKANEVPVPCSVMVPPGGTSTLFETNGAGSIASLRLWMTPYSTEAFFGTRLRITWDGASTPAVDIPIGVFFGGGGKDFDYGRTIPSRKLANLLYGFDGEKGEFHCYWPMPFWKSAKIEIVNPTTHAVTLSGVIGRVPADKVSYPENQAGYFCVKETKDKDPGGGIFASAFSEKGFGHIVGIGFYSQNYSMDGDEFSYFDGSRTPQVHGDGTEDDHNQGWGGAAYQKPLWGSLINGFEGAYRLYLNDSYVFDDQADIHYEYSLCGPTSNSQTDIVIYYYKASGAGRLKQTDEMAIGQSGQEKAHHYSVDSQTWAGTLTSAYDGYEKKPNLATVTADGRAYNGTSSFTVTIDPANQGVRLRRLLSRVGNGVQTAEVSVDGVKVKRPWHVVFNSSAPAGQAWVDSDFELPASLTQGKSNLQIKIRHLASTKGELNEFHYWVFCHMPPEKAR